ncbi:DUF1702 family protein [Actinomadura sp. WMMB 499]|uniref:DUF1702 family protein n=1 Tax=Actinomadura sp. WMMB 499 TaxID=1219491 RepID=UPI00159D397D|nr:DUF1702 family protein [Actinomadura sp. WMMB 499]
MLDEERISLDKYGHARGDTEIRARLEGVVGAFAAGYNAALAEREGPLDLCRMPQELRGFAYEGAAMSRTLLDLVTCSRGRRLDDLRTGPGRGYPHLIHVGAGWAYARLRLRPRPSGKDAGGLPRWLAWDGWGFHNAYFRPGPVYRERRVERAARGEVRPVRDQGAGRALWFHACADPERIEQIIGRFPGDRRADLWAGVGLAAAYTGVQPRPVLARLGEASGVHRGHLAQGAAFAAKAHVLSGEVPGRVGAAVAELCGTTADTAAEWTDTALAVASARGGGVAAYQQWRAGVRRAWQNETGGVRA